jgi:ATP-dependent Lhr-like helicase
LRLLVRGTAVRGQLAGRWSLVQTLTSPPAHVAAAQETADEERIEFHARALLRRYGVVFRRLLTREPGVVSWRDLVRVYRTLESRGEIRGGRFVAGMSGEQFATPSAVERLREIRRTPGDGRLIALSAADPLNLAGVVTAGDRIRVQAASRVLYRNGIPLAAMEGEFLRPLTELPPAVASQVATALAGRSLPAVTSGYVGRSR